MIASFLSSLYRSVTVAGFVILLAGSMSCHSPDPPQARLPNIIIILADDLGYGDLSGYGATLVFTPNIDMLMREGMKFTDAYAGFSVCTPTRYSLLTGRYAWRGEYERGTLRPLSANLIEQGRPTIA